MLSAPERFKVLNCGRRFGKTVLSLVAVVEGHGPMVDGKPTHPGAVHGAHVWWLAPIYKQALEVWDILKLTLGGVGKVSEAEWRITLPGGGWVQVRSTDNPDNLRGSGLDGVVLDEAASMDPTVWSTVIRPALADRQGWAIFCSTPKGTNWFHDVYTAAADNPTWVRWTRSTMDNTHIPRAEIDALMAEMSEQEIRQELYADFLVLAAQRFSAQAVENGRRLVLPPLASAPLPAGVDPQYLRLWELPNPGSSYVAYTDPALGVRRDYTTTLVAEVAGRSLRHVATLRERELEPSQHGMMAVALAQWYNTALYGVEAAKGEAVLYAVGASGYSRVYRHPRVQTQRQQMAGGIVETTPGLPITGQTRTGFVEDLAVYVDGGRFTSPDVVFWDECATFVIDARGRAAAMEGKHDDVVMAAVGLVQLAQSAGASRPMKAATKARAPRSASFGGVYAQWGGR